jgi:hypothetical protein
LVFGSRTRTLRRVAGLERVKPILVFFETLESDFEFGLVQIRGKAQKRRSPEMWGRVTRGEILERDEG